MLHGEVKLTENVPRVLLFDLTIKLTLPLGAIGCEFGVTCRCVVSYEAVTVPAGAGFGPGWVLMVTVAVLPPFFLTETGDALNVVLQTGPGTLPGTPAVPAPASSFSQFVFVLERTVAPTT